jgi:hypothetical protein
MTCAVKHQTALLLWRLGRNEAHCRPPHGLADGLSIRGIILLPLDVGLHVSRRHQPHGVAKRLELARPMMRRGAGLNADQAWRQLLEERQDVAPLQLTADDCLAGSINAMYLKD